MDIPTASAPRPNALSALIGGAGPAGAAAESGRLLDLPIDRVVRNEAQPRTSFDPEALAALATSIEARGIIQPIAVRQVGRDRFELIAGERRWLAAQRAGLRTVPAVVLDVDERESLVLALVENVVRQDLNPLETARAYQSLLDEHDIAIAELARALGKSRPAVSNTLRLLELPDDVLESIHAGRLREGHGRALLGLSDRSMQRRLARLAIDRSLSVRALEAAVRAHEEAGDDASTVTPRWASHPEPELQQAFDRLVDRLDGGMAARLRVGQRQVKLELRCRDQAALEQLLDRLAASLDGGPAGP